MRTAIPPSSLRCFVAVCSLALLGFFGSVPKEFTFTSNESCHKGNESHVTYARTKCQVGKYLAASLLTLLCFTEPLSSPYVLRSKKSTGKCAVKRNKLRWLKVCNNEEIKSRLSIDFTRN